MALVTWEDRYNVGVREIDEQHRHLVDILNQLHDAMREGRGKAVLGDIITETLSYTRTHFATEERLFDRHSYAKAADHRKEHEEFVGKVASFADDFAKKNVMLTAGILEFLRSWLMGHILGSDQEFGEFLRSRGVA